MRGNIETDVLVVGAGPTGLTMAHELCRSGVRCHLIDKAGGPSVHSKALAVQARSLEIFRFMRLEEAFLKKGFRAPGIRIYIRGRYVAQGELTGLLDAGTRFNYLLIISQADTEKIICEGLDRHGGTVNWHTECLRFERTETNPYPVVATCRHRDGREYEVRARYLVGCDGAHSMVRHAMPVQFNGDAYQQRFILADGRISWDHPYDYLNLFFGKTGLCIFFPFREKHFGRLILMDKKDAAGQEPNVEQVMSFAEDYTGSRLMMTDVDWISGFRLHHRVATSYSDGPVFICGDAAHIHSPAGGQGMNTGIQDAYNLAWKLVFAIQGHATEALIRSYHNERHPVGQHLLKRTDRLFSFASSGNRFIAMIRNFLMRALAPVLLSRPRCRASIFSFVSQLGTRYRRSSIVMDDAINAPRKFRLTLPPGHRLPDFPIDSVQGPAHLHDILTGTGYVLLWHRPKDEDLMLRTIDIRLSRLKPFLTHVVISQVSDTHRGDIQMFKDRTGSAARLLGGALTSLFLIRPDGHIAVRVWGQDVKAVLDYFERVHGIPGV